MIKIKVLIITLASIFMCAEASFALTCKSLFPVSQKKLKVSVPMHKFETAFASQKPVIGMIHLSGNSNSSVVKRAIAELKLFEKMGVHAAIVENYHGDIQQVELVLQAIQGKFPKIKIGINILPNDYALAFSLARKYGAQFIQLDFVSGNYKSGWGVVNLDAADYESYRNEYKEVLVLGGVHPKYYHPIKGSNLATDIHEAMTRADAIVVTGAGTGKETPMDKINNFRNIIGPNFPLVIGAGMTADSAAQQLPISQGVIVGSYFKNGVTSEPVDPKQVEKFMAVHAEVSKK